MTTPDYSFPSITPWTNAQVRNGPFPLDRYSVFSSLVDAKEYAAGVLAYAGQVIAVTENGKQNVYALDPTLSTGDDGYLRKLPDAKDIENTILNGYVTGDSLSGFENDTSHSRYGVRLSSTGAYVQIPAALTGGVDVDGTTIVKGESDVLSVEASGISSSIETAMNSVGYKKESELKLLSSQISGMNTEPWTFYTDEHPDGVVKYVCVLEPPAE